MRLSPMLLLHICAGTLGVLSGFTAAFLRKGSPRHRAAGNVFVIAMLSLGATGAYLAFMKSQTGNFFGGVLTFYLVATGWRTARRRESGTNIFDWIGFVAALLIGVVMVANGFKAAHSPRESLAGVPVAMYFFMGSIPLIAAAGDLRMLLRGGISGTQRLARHLWRMCFGLFIASGSIFAARPHLFPALMRKSGVLYLLTVMPLILMVFWLVRIRWAGGYKRKPMPSRSNAYSLRA
ncbi:MAG TPA: hypothetical protein VLA83_15395 [Candidatus Binatia bacterium]|nr:hypothetical protein [Candidatus Binatia bacterium]